MVGALERYVDGSGLGDPAKELARFFASPASYEVALQQRLVDHLTRRGKELIVEKQQAAALEQFDRVLTLDAKNAPVLAILDRMASKRRTGHVIAAVAICAVAGGAWYARRAFTPTAMSQVEPTPHSNEPVGSDGIANVVVPIAAPDAAPITSMALAADAQTAGVATAHKLDARAAEIDAGAATTVVVMVSPADSAVSIDGAAAQTYDGGRVPVEIGDHPVHVSATNACCEGEDVTVTADDAQKGKLINLGFLPATIIAHCKTPGVEVHVNKQMVALDHEFPIAFGHTTTTEKTAVVEFFSKDLGVFDTQTVTVRYHETKEVTCAR
jgi:hypothetical protein